VSIFKTRLWGAKFDLQGMKLAHTQKVKLTPRLKLAPTGLDPSDKVGPPGVKFSIHPSIIHKNLVCSVLHRGEKFTPRGPNVFPQTPKFFSMDRTHHVERTDILIFLQLTRRLGKLNHAIVTALCKLDFCLAETQTQPFLERITSTPR
jgi:hypothetical protein